MEVVYVPTNQLNEIKFETIASITSSPKIIPMPHCLECSLLTPHIPRRHILGNLDDLRSALEEQSFPLWRIFVRHLSSRPRMT